MNDIVRYLVFVPVWVWYAAFAVLGCAVVAWWRKTERRALPLASKVPEPWSRRARRAKLFSVAALLSLVAGLVVGLGSGGSRHESLEFSDGGASAVVVVDLSGSVSDQGEAAQLLNAATKRIQEEFGDRPVAWVVFSDAAVAVAAPAPDSSSYDRAREMVRVGFQNFVSGTRIVQGVSRGARILDAEGLPGAPLIVVTDMGDEFDWHPVLQQVLDRGWPVKIVALKPVDSNLTALRNRVHGDMEVFVLKGPNDAGKVSFDVPVPAYAGYPTAHSDETVPGAKTIILVASILGLFSLFGIVLFGNVPMKGVKHEGS